MKGWDYIGQWSGVPLGDFLRRVRADLKARYAAFQTADNYPSSIDMATALHPQTLLGTRDTGAPITDPFGYQLRLRTSTKLGFKNPKWITSMEVTDANPAATGKSRASTGSAASSRLLVKCFAAIRSDRFR